MWRSKKGYKKFLSIVKEMDFVIDDVRSKERLLNFEKQNVGHGEEYQIYRLKQFVRNHVGWSAADTQFNMTKDKLAYFNRWLEYNDS